jgi:hypothetical protein
MKKVIETMKSAITRILMGACLAIAAAAPSYAAITNAGQNIGTWIQEQGFYIALAIVVIVLIKFLLKKAWIPAGAFVIVGGILLFVISSPDSLKSVGQALYNLVVK